MANVGHTVYGQTKKKLSCMRCGTWILTRLPNLGKKSGRKNDRKVMCTKCEKETKG